MDGSARLVVRPGPARTALEVVAATPPFSLHRCGDRILFGASAAGPLRGDRLGVDLEVLSGASADVGSVGAMSIHPGPRSDDRPSMLTTRCSVGDGAHLRWWPEPVVSIAGSDHVSATTVDLGADSTCVVVEEVSLGRTCEPSGRLRLELDVVRAGRGLVRHAETFGPPGAVAGSGSLVSVGTGRHVLAAVVVGVEPGPSRTILAATCRAARLAVDDDAMVVLAVGDDRPSVTSVVGELAPELAAQSPRPASLISRA